MNNFFFALTLLTVALSGCESTSGSSGGGPKCTAPQEMLRCDKVLNIAHGGGLLIRPTHTIEAYDQALADGADMLELDIHETLDGVIVVMHDATVDDTTSCSGAIKEMTFAELRECDAGYHFTKNDGQTYPYRGMGLVVPSLEEVLERYPDTAVNIEIKQVEPSLVHNLVDLVRQYEFEDKMVGVSFSDEAVAELRDAAPEIATSLSEGEALDFWTKSWVEIDPAYVPPGEFLQLPVEYNLGGGIVPVLHDGFVPRVEELDMFVHIWTVNDEDEMRWLIEVQGVHGIMTDDPPLLTKVINELGAGD